MKLRQNNNKLGTHSIVSIIFWGGTGGLYTTSSTSLRSQLQYAVETCINACKIRQKFIYLHEKK